MTEPRGAGRQRPRLTATVTDLEVVIQRAYLVGVVLGKGDVQEAETSLAELELLTDTAGSDPVEAVLVRRDKPDAATFVGHGKVAQLAAETKAMDIDVVIFDNELSPAQQRNLSKLFEVDVVDRVAVILDIFAQHASSREGMLQVELAQLRYRLPRLRGKGTQLSRLGGGTGTRFGGGETKLETDRRRILERVTKLERELKHLERSRSTRTKARKRAELPHAALVGYTNAGKSTLFNRLTDAGVLVEDRLFATVDSTIRRTDLPSGRPMLVSDTVGFVRHLPHQLVEAFRSTLEEVAEADLLLHVIDGADADPDRQIQAVREVLQEIGAGTVDELIVINKADIAETATIDRLLAVHPDAVVVSAVTGAGIDELLTEAGLRLEGVTVDVELVIPYDRGEVVSTLHDVAEILSENHGADGTHLEVRLEKRHLERFAEFTQPVV